MQPKLKVEEEEVFISVAEDLCCTCVNKSDCTLRQNQSEPVHQCNEYDDGSPQSARFQGRLYSLPMDEEPAAQVDDQKLRGLCLNCEHRATCTLPKAAGGVWHCEEYE